MKVKVGKICFVIPSLSSGGAERVVSVLASQLAKDGNDIVIIKYFENDNEYPVYSRVRTICLADGYEEEYKKISFSNKVKLLRGILIKEQPNYVVPFLPHVSLHVFLASIGIRLKLIHTIRNAPNKSPESKVLRKIRDILIAISYRTFVQTESQKQYFNIFTQKKIVVLPNPISDSMFKVRKDYSEKVEKIVAVGRLTEQKNFKLVIEAVKMLHDAGKSVDLSIYGEGELRDELSRYINYIRVQEYCHLCGRSNDIAAILEANHVFVLSSNFEGMPNALMEALAAGLPCVSTDCETGPSDLIGDNRGILIPVNDVEKMESAIRYMIDHPHEAMRMGVRGREYMQKKFSSKRIAERFIEEVVLGAN